MLLTQRNKLDEFRLAHITDQIIALKEKNIGVILVISGAVACGAKFVDFSLNDRDSKQAAAGVGQAYVISVIQRIFSKKNLQIAQILITKDLLNLEVQKQKISKLLKYYLQIGIVPVLNENDVIALNDFGGNDFLAVEIARILGATQIMILSTMKGSEFGVGGGESKRIALQRADGMGIKSLIANGKVKNVILKAL